VAEEIADKGKSAWKGDHLKSGELGKFASQIFRGEIPRGSVLVVESLDRLSRQGHYEARRWIEDVCAAGMQIATVSGDRIYDDDSLRSNDKVFEIMEILMKAAAAHDYVTQLSKRLESSWVRRRGEASKGVVVSAHVPGWLTVVGERGDPTRHFEPIPERVRVVVRIYEMAAAGMGARLIAATLNADGIPSLGRDQARHANRKNIGWEHTYIGDLLQSAAVEGDYIASRRRKPGQPKADVPKERIAGYFGAPIVDADLVARARAAVARRKGTGGRGKGSEALRNLFAGSVTCVVYILPETKSLEAVFFRPPTAGGAL
jgi:DNA invertase Pin-like site-specific DNA recombinase